MFSLINRGEYPQAIEDEFEALFARLRSLLGQTFDIDGNLIVADPSLAVVPVGGVMPYAATDAPTGWLLCDGSPVSRVEYRGLFTVIGTAYGAGDGSTTFNIPNLTGRFPLGKAAAGTGSALGATGGAIDHTHTGPSHTHTGPSHSHTISSGGGHSHTVSSHSHSISSGGSHDHGGNTGQTNGTAIPVGEGATTNRTGDHTHTISSDGSHDHGGSTGGQNPGTDTQGSHDHGGTTGSGGAGTTGAGGTGATGTANPPFIALNYIIFAGA